MGKRILLSGYFGFDNLGDEAILEAECARWRQLAPGVELAVLMDNKERAQELELKAYPRQSPLQIWKAINEADLVVSGGGGLFQDSTGFKSVMYYGAILALASIARKPSILFSQGFGPIKTNYGRLLAKALLPLATRATFRDQPSLEEFKEYAPQVPAEVTADPVFLLEPGSLQASQEVWQRCQLPDPAAPVVIVALRPWLDLKLEMWAHALNEWGESIPEADRPQLLLVPFQYWYDQGVAKRLGSLLRLQHALAPPLKVGEMLALMAAPQVELVVAMRLHALIMAAVAGKACLSVSYDPKVQRTAQRCGYLNLDWEGLAGGSLKTSLERVWQERVANAREAQSRLPQLREQAERAFTLAGELL